MGNSALDHTETHVGPHPCMHNVDLDPCMHANITPMHAQRGRQPKLHGSWGLKPLCHELQVMHNQDTT